MISYCGFLARTFALALFAVAPVLSLAQQADAKSALTAPLLVDGLGKGTAALHGPWQFHPGDDPAWASVAFDDSGWPKLSADQSWGEQGYARLTGFAWYRCHLELLPAPGIAPDFSLLMPNVYDAYEVYWNGKLIGGDGKLPPHPVWYYSQSPRIFKIGRAQRGVLAVRIWKAPLLSDDSGLDGGFDGVPEIGSPDAIAFTKAALDYQWLHDQQFLFGENLIYVLVSVLSFFIWCRNPSRWLLFWMTGFSLVPPALLLLLNSHLSIPYIFAMGAAQPLSSIRDISLWFLLVWLLLLHENRAIVRLTSVLACVSFANATLDGVLVATNWNPKWTLQIQTLDGALTLVFSALQAFPLLLVSYACVRREKFDFVRWQVAFLAFGDEMILAVRNVAKQGRQFTHWSFASKIESPLFTVGGSAVSLPTLAGALLLISIAYAVYHSILEDQRRQIALEREKLELMRAREQMRHYAEHDGLTGLWNHRIIVERLRGEVERSHRDGTPLSVVLADIDYFKKINDTFGHPTGDLVLKEIGSTFTRSVRTYDWVGRYGGEEFLIILPGSSLDSALIRAEELRLAVQSACIVDGGTTLQVTASFGVASDFPRDYEAETIIRTVDAALYRAKSSGRNCVVAAEMDMQLCGS